MLGAIGCPVASRCAPTYPGSMRAFGVLVAVVVWVSACSSGAGSQDPDLGAAGAPQTAGAGAGSSAGRPGVSSGSASTTDGGASGAAVEAGAPSADSAGSSGSGLELAAGSDQGGTDSGGSAGVAGGPTAGGGGTAGSVVSAGGSGGLQTVAGAGGSAGSSAGGSGSAGAPNTIKCPDSCPFGELQISWPPAQSGFGGTYIDLTGAYVFVPYPGNSSMVKATALGGAGGLVGYRVEAADLNGSIKTIYQGAVKLIPDRLTFVTLGQP